MKNKVILLGLCLLMVTSISKGQSQEHKVQAIFLLKFIENVSWPKEKKGLVIGVVGAADVLGEIEARLKAKNPDEIVVRKISASESGTCDVIYLPSAKDGQISSVKEAVQNKSILVITESELSKKGAGISFQKENGKLQFVINKTEVESRGLKIGSTLLSLGTQV